MWTHTLFIIMPFLKEIVLIKMFFSLCFIVVILRASKSSKDAKTSVIKICIYVI